jgi:hypothetical protein
VVPNSQGAQGAPAEEQQQ